MFIKTENEKIINASNWKVDETYMEIDFNYENYIDKPQNYYIFNEENIVENPEFEKEEQEEKRKKISKLSLTKREVFLAIFEDKGLTPEDIRNQINDTSALIEFDYATEYFRGNPLIDSIGSSLGYTSEDLDYLFQNGFFRKKGEE